MGYWTAQDPAARPVSHLAWELSGIAIGVCAIVFALVLAGVLRRRRPTSGESVIARPAAGLAWIYVGGGLTIAVLAVAYGAMLRTMAATRAPAVAIAPLSVEITAHRWWWEIRYLDTGSENAVTTANEMHIPTGEPIALVLQSSDVIHSFWVPRLAGKTDAIPGRQAAMWLEADSAGTYVGACAEYCGAQHAHMGITVVAESPIAFQAWRAHESEDARPASDALSAGGAAVFARSCGSCHTVRGTPATGRVGPDLSHVASRTTIALGVLPNARGALTAWIEDAPAIKPGTPMPRMDLSPAELHAVTSYVETLR